MYELLTGKSLFCVVPLDGDKSDEETNDEHLLQISEVLLNPLPQRFLDAWDRGPCYVDAKCNRLEWMKGAGGSADADCMRKDAESSKGSFQNDVGLQDDFRQMDEDSCSQSGASEYSVPLADPPPFSTLENRFHEDKLADIDESEEKQILSLLRWILQIEPQQRPAVEEILKDPWFQGVNPAR